jgi:hypothetical protein
VLVSRPIVAVIVAAALGAPAVAAAQTTTVPRGSADVSSTPPVPLPPEGPAGDRMVGSDVRKAAAGELPNTGSDPRVLFLCGVALTLLGVGLRLRTADADLY